LRVLVLGGTAEARRLAAALGARAVLSLAGAVPHPPVAGQRSGGFGGVDGLADYLTGGGYTAIVDATHPFAARISGNAVAAADKARVPLLRLVRPPWLVRAGWQVVPDLAAAADALPAGARVLLTVGGRSLGAFVARGDLWVLVRSIVAPAALPAQAHLHLARPPFALADEMRLMQDHRISHLVSKNAGGAATAAKLEAAEALGVQAIMVARPSPPDAFTVATVAEAIKWVENLGGMT
jgi:precorrin-6A/cobalt-precorrin-6A reductase